MIDSLCSCHLCAEAHVIGYWYIGRIQINTTVGAIMPHAPTKELLRKVVA